ncbi:MAG: hypothetical protein KF829_00795 [Ferruginibacter sp.]|nr:hypothetical protein [Ferruginibacter sp.]
MITFWGKLGLVLFAFCSNRLELLAQRPPNMVMMEYKVTVTSIDSSAGFLNGSTLLIYLNHDECREEIRSPDGGEIRFFNSKTGKGAILKNYSGQKLQVPLSRDNWTELNTFYNSISFTVENVEDAVICGYLAKKAKAQLPGNRELVVYFAPGFVPANQLYSYAFPQLKGLPLKIERHTPDATFVWELNDIQFGNLPPALFDINTKGYRLLPFEVLQVPLP